MLLKSELFAVDDIVNLIFLLIILYQYVVTLK